MAGKKRGQNEGSVYQRASDGKWVGAVTLPTGQRKVVYGVTRAEAARKLVAVLRALQQGLPVQSDERLTVAGFLDRWLEVAVRPTLRRRTVVLYEQHIRLYLTPVLGSVRLTALTVAQVQEALNALVDPAPAAARRRQKHGGGGAPLAPATVRHARGVLRSALQAALRWGLVQRNVAALARPPARPAGPAGEGDGDGVGGDGADGDGDGADGRITPLSVEEAHALLAAAARPRPGLPILGAEGHALRPLLVLALATGLRLGEVLALTWDDVDLERGTLTVRATLERLPVQARSATMREARVWWRLAPPKSARSRRTVPLVVTARQALVAQRRLVQRRDMIGPGGGRHRWPPAVAHVLPPAGFVFSSQTGGPIDARRVQHDFHRLLREAGLPRHRFHDLRHTAATFLLAAGADLRVVMAILGHTNIALTSRYVHVLPAVLAEAAEKLDALFLVATRDGREGRDGVETEGRLADADQPTDTEPTVLGDRRG